MKRLLFALINCMLLMLFFAMNPAGAAELRATQLHTEMVVSASQLNVRSAPDVNAGKVSVIKKDAVVTAFAVKDGWFKIALSSNKFGWVSGSYLYTKGTDPSQKIVSSAQVVVTSTIANVRTGAGLNYPIAATLKKGDAVTSVNEQADWTAVRLPDSTQGFVKSSLVQKVTMVLSSWDEPEPESSFKKLDNTPQPPAGQGDNQQTANNPLPNNPPPQQSNDSEMKILNIEGTPGNANIALTKLEAIRQQNELLIRITGDKPLSFNFKQDGSQININIPGAGGLTNGSYDVKVDKVDNLQISSGSDTALTINASPDTTFTTENIPDKMQFLVRIPVKGGLLNGKVIVIDAGHGSMQYGSPDPGAQGPKGTKERDVVLEIAKKTRDLLQIQGATVLMTRETDRTDLSLNGRARLANDNKADAFVAIHANASNSPTLAGTSTYFYAPAGTALGSQRDARKKLAKAVQTALVDKLKRRSIGVLEANFQVLRDTTVPSILVETAFISNPEEEGLLAEDYFRQQAAEGIANGLINYFSH